MSPIPKESTQVSAEPKMETLPHIVPAEAAEPKVFDMTPKEAMAFGRLMQQRAQIESEIEGIGNQARARLGLAVEAKVSVDLDAAVYRVRT